MRAGRHEGGSTMTRGEQQLRVRVAVVTGGGQGIRPGFIGTNPELHVAYPSPAPGARATSRSAGAKVDRESRRARPSSTASRSARRKRPGPQ